MPDDAGVQTESLDLGAGEAGRARRARSAARTRPSPAPSSRGTSRPSRGPRRGAPSRGGRARRDRARGRCSVAPSPRAIACTSSRSASDDLLAAGRLDEQARPLRIGGPRVGVHRRHDPGVQELDPRHAGAGRDDARRGPARALDVGERDAQRDRVLGDRVQPHRDLRDHGERALRADEQPREVVAGRRLRARVPVRITRPSARTASSASDVGAHLPVAHRRRARRRWSRPCRRASRRRPGRPGRRGRAPRRRARA